MLLLLFFSWSAHVLYHCCLHTSQAYLSIQPIPSTLDFGYGGQKLTCATIFAHRNKNIFNLSFFYCISNIFKAFGWTL